MPYYDFACQGCGKVFEENIPMSRTETPSCPECGSGQTRKLISGCALGGSSSSAGCGRGGFTWASWARRPGPGRLPGYEGAMRRLTINQN